jgi:hypothetical protein
MESEQELSVSLGPDLKERLRLLESESRRFHSHLRSLKRLAGEVTDVYNEYGKSTYTVKTATENCKLIFNTRTLSSRFHSFLYNTLPISRKKYNLTN